MVRIPLIRRHPLTGRQIEPLGYRADGRAIWPILGGDESTDPKTRINELAALGLETLTTEQLAELRGLIVAERDAIRADPTAVDMAHITAIGEYATSLKVETERRDAQANEALAALAALDETLADPAPAPVEPVVDVTAETPAAPTEVVPVAEAPVPVAASTRPTLTPLAAVHQTPHQHTEPTADTRAPVVAVLTASAGRMAGQQISGREEWDNVESMAESFDEAFKVARATRSGRGYIPITASRWKSGEESLVVGGGADQNRSKMDRAYRRSLTPITAAGGGICSPVGVDYSIPTWVNVEEPVKASLPRIDAPRGGIQYGVAVPYNATTYGAGIGIWSNPNDKNPGGSSTGPLSNPTGTGPSVKPCARVDCSNFVEVDVEAITSCITISNFRSRFSPENMEMVLGYMKQAFAATAEIERLKQMRSFANHVTVGQVFGASTDVLNFLDRVRAYFRSIYRLSNNVPLRVVLPAYVREAIRIDIRKAAFPFESDTGNSINIPDAMIDDWLLASNNFVPTWTLDDDIGDQTFAAATAGTLGSPSTFPWFPVVGHGSPGATTINFRMLCYPEGSFQLLDGGELNLGVVRDSALNAVNEYQVFSEIFEAVAWRGFEAVDFQGSFIANGAKAGTISPV